MVEKKWLQSEKNSEQIVNQVVKNSDSLFFTT